jgi:hypothetical protein
MPSINEIFETALEQLELTELQLKNMENVSPKARKSAAVAAVAMARTSYHSLKKLQEAGQEAREWFKKINERLSKSEVSEWVRKTRDRMLKEADLSISSGMHIESFSSDQIPTPPPNAVSFFLGDEIGGSGWFVLHPDGSESKYYIDVSQTFPESNITSWLTTTDMPGEYFGEPIEKIIQALVEEYRLIIAEGKAQLKENS